MTHPNSYVRTDGKGKFLRVDICTCDISRNDLPSRGGPPIDKTCAIYDKHLALWRRTQKKIP